MGLGLGEAGRERGTGARSKHEARVTGSEMGEVGRAVSVAAPVATSAVVAVVAVVAVAAAAVAAVASPLLSRGMREICTGMGAPTRS